MVADQLRHNRQVTIRLFRAPIPDPKFTFCASLALERLGMISWPLGAPYFVVV